MPNPRKTQLARKLLAAGESVRMTAKLAGVPLGDVEKLAKATTVQAPKKRMCRCGR